MAEIKSNSLKDAETQSSMRIPEGVYLILTAILMLAVIGGILFLY